ncbi:MAG TPA: oligoendopeptidase F [Myxococcales bacterium]|nr:oligoendopeptidase F [Myxococcales bacterium]
MTKTLLSVAALLALGCTAHAGPKSAPIAFVPDANVERSQIPELYKWKLAPMFVDDAAFETTLSAVGAELEKIAAYKGKLAEPAELRACLDQYFQTRLAVNKMTLYAQMRRVSDLKNTGLQAMESKALKAFQDFMAASSFIRQEVLALDEAAVQAAYAKEPKLAEYKPYLSEMLRRRSRVLDEQTERVLSLAGDNLWAEIDLNEIPSDHEKTFDALLADMPLPTITDESGKQVQLTLSNFPKYRGSTDRNVRREAVEKLFSTLRQYEHVFAATLSGQVNFNVFLARSRGYATALHAYMDKDNIDTAVYHSLIKAVNENLAPLHRYVKLRKQVMGLDELHLYDLYTPMVASVQMKFPYPEAQKVLLAALEPLGDGYLKTLKVGLDPAQGWLDLYPHKNKQSGAFCSSTYGIHPYVKMNYFEDLGDLSTLAHEYGHALHSHYAMTTQPYVTASYSMFNAEIASTFNEKLLSDHLYKTAKTREEKLYVLNKLVESIRTTIYRQALFAEFELAAHTAAEQGTPLTAELLNSTYADLVRRYYGPDFTVGENDGIEWAYVPHFYYKYYMYSYATGLSSGIALAEKVQTGGKKAREAYLGMLKAGSSKPPVELLKDAGVDLTKPEAIEAAARLMDRTLAEMEKLLAQGKK